MVILAGIRIVLFSLCYVFREQSNFGRNLYMKVLIFARFIGSWSDITMNNGTIVMYNTENDQNYNFHYQFIIFVGNFVDTCIFRDLNDSS